MVLKPFSSVASILAFALLLFNAQNTVAQYSRKSLVDASSWEIGFSGGVSRFLTSVNPNSDAIYKRFNYWNADFNAAITLSIIKNISPKFSAEFEFLTTKLSGQWNENSGYPIPAASGNVIPSPFKTGINQFDLMLVVNLNQIVASNSASDKWYLFVKGGGGAAFLKEYNGLFPYSKPGNKFEYTILYGGGLSYNINDKINLKLGSLWCRVATDRLDGIHTAKNNGEKGNAGFYYNVNERYIYPYIGVSYGFGQTVTKASKIQGTNRRSIWKKPANRIKSSNRMKSSKLTKSSSWTKPSNSSKKRSKQIKSRP